MEILSLNNKGKETIYNYLQKDIDKNSEVTILNMQFTLFAFQELEKELRNCKKADLIITSPNLRGLEILGDSYEIEKRNELKQKSIAISMKKWIEEKLSISMSQDGSFIGNSIINIKNNPTNTMINGTFKFSLEGIGVIPSSNFYANTYIKTSKDEPQNDINKELKSRKLKDIKKQFIDKLNQLIEENSPSFIYYITLYNIFKNGDLDLINESLNTRTGIEKTKIWKKLYKFQEDGARGIIAKLEKHKGCILADSVGLGKTFTALAVIKYYELRNDRVLVLAPKKLRENWSIYTQNDSRNQFLEDRFNYDVLNHTDLSRYDGYSGEINLENINWSNYDLVVIDESHNFRNNFTKKDKVTRYERMMDEVIKSGVKTKVLMLSATPVNTKMNDLKNQISFITEEKDGAFIDSGIKSIESTLRIAQQKFNKWSELPDEKRTTFRFISEINNDYFKLLDTITIARSRKHIEKYYGLADIGEFPERLKPVNIYSDIDLENRFPKLEDINKTINNLNFAVYSPLKYVLPSKRKKYSEKYDTSVKGGKSIFRQTDREESLIGLMRVNMLKRMESSIYSFGISIARLLSKIDSIIKKIDNAKINNSKINNSRIDRVAEVDIDEELEDEDLDMITVGKKIEISLSDMDLLRWREELEDDKKELERILKATVVINPKRDEKLGRLKELIDNKLRNPINTSNKKILIFTAFADTADYLYGEIAKEFKDKYNINSAIVKGTGGNSTTMKGVKPDEINTVLTHFSPRSKEREKDKFKEEIDILIATDCISEGQNLQDCDYLVNYDIHWNPVRIIQRFGRIDRIGSQNDVIQLVNFWPNMELDEYINLESRVKSRMVLSDVSSTGEENVLDVNKKEMNDLKYRQKQLLQLQNEVVELEDISGGISITDLTFNDFKMDLERTMEEKGEPEFSGLYAIAKIPEDLKAEYKPGVIFLLEQVEEDIKAKDYNPFHPYYLSYVTYDEKIKYSYTHTKNILDIMKKLSSEESVDFKLEEKFKGKTKNYSDMKIYRKLLERSVEEIIGAKQEDGIASLFQSEGTSIGVDKARDIDSFEVITYLILE